MPAVSAVTPEQIAQMIELRKLKKPNGKSLYTYTAIGELVGDISKGQAEYYVNRSEPKPEINVIEVDEKDLPLTMINGGQMRTLPVQAPRGRYSKKHKKQSSCDFCPRREQCNQAMRRWCGDFIECEAPLEREMMKEEVAQ